MVMPYLTVAASLVQALYPLSCIVGLPLKHRGSVERLSRRFMTEFEWKGHQYIHCKSEKIALVKKEADGQRLQVEVFGARENEVSV